MDDERYEGVVLLDVSPREAGEFDRDLLERMGHPVLVCEGPSDDRPCPLLAGERCSKLDKAHGVVFLLDLDRPEIRTILQRYRQTTPADVPIRALVSREQAQRYADLLADVEVWTHEPTVADLDGFAAEVEAADRLA